MGRSRTCSDVIASRSSRLIASLGTPPCMIAVCDVTAHSGRAANDRVKAGHSPSWWAGTRRERARMGSQRLRCGKHDVVHGCGSRPCEVHVGSGRVRRATKARSGYWLDSTKYWSQAAPAFAMCVEVRVWVWVCSACASACALSACGCAHKDTCARPRRASHTPTRVPHPRDSLVRGRPGRGGRGVVEAVEVGDGHAHGCNHGHGEVWRGTTRCDETL